MSRPVNPICVNGHDKDVVGRYKHGGCRACVNTRAARYSRNYRERRGQAPLDTLDRVRLPAGPLLRFAVPMLDRLPDDDRERVLTWYTRHRKTLTLADIDRICCTLGYNPVSIYGDIFLTIEDKHPTWEMTA